MTTETAARRILAYLDNDTERAGVDAILANRKYLGVLVEDLRAAVAAGTDLAAVAEEIDLDRRLQ